MDRGEELVSKNPGVKVLKALVDADPQIYGGVNNSAAGTVGRTRAGSRIRTGRTSWPSWRQPALRTAGTSSWWREVMRLVIKNPGRKTKVLKALVAEAP